MVEVIRGVTLAILWICIIINGLCIHLWKQRIKELDKALADTWDILHGCENCIYYVPGAEYCYTSDMRMMGNSGFCCYRKRKEKTDDGENHN